jgi:hypothetical protein
MRQPENNPAKTGTHNNSLQESQAGEAGEDTTWNRSNLVAVQPPSKTNKTKKERGRKEKRKRWFTRRRLLTSNTTHPDEHHRKHAFTYKSLRLVRLEKAPGATDAIWLPPRYLDKRASSIRQPSREHSSKRLLTDISGW